MDCNCGDTMSVEAKNIEEAAQKLKSAMTSEKIKEHFASRHQGESMPHKAFIDAQIEKSLEPVMA